MAYSGKMKPPERASRVGQVPLLKNRRIRSAVSKMKPASHTASGTPGPSLTWKPIVMKGEAPFSSIIAVDGSYSIVQAKGGTIGYIKAAVLGIYIAKLGALDAHRPHPLLLRDILDEDTQVFSAAIPLDGIAVGGCTPSEAFSQAIYTSLRRECGGKPYTTLRWLLHREWSSPVPSPSFSCPYCGKEDAGFMPGKDRKTCYSCGHELILTDAMGLAEVDTFESMASSFMRIMEFLLLMGKIRDAMKQGPEAFKDTLFMPDGPLAFFEGFYRFTNCARSLMQYCRETGLPLYLCGVEKGGSAQGHVCRAAKGLDIKPSSYCVLPHKYIEENILWRLHRQLPYGARSNWGEKVGVKVSDDAIILANLPVGAFDSSEGAPNDADLMGKDRILAALPKLVCALYENALYPVAMANERASLSLYPSQKILQEFTADVMGTGA